MVAVDTNVIVRFLTGDDPEQFRQSVQTFQTHQIFIPDTVILETEWVLRWAYEFEPPQIVAAFKKLLGLPSVHVKSITLISLAIEWHEKGLDFADAFHLAQSQHCTQMLTFDKEFIDHSQEIASCPVKSPN